MVSNDMKLLRHRRFKPNHSSLNIVHVKPILGYEQISWLWHCACFYALPLLLVFIFSVSSSWSSHSPHFCLGISTTLLPNNDHHLCLCHCQVLVDQNRPHDCCVNLHCHPSGPRDCHARLFMAHNVLHIKSRQENIMIQIYWHQICTMPRQTNEHEEPIFTSSLQNWIERSTL